MKTAQLICVVALLAAFSFGQSNPVPLINNPLVPDAVAPGGDGFTLTVNGTGFVASSVVNWNGSALATHFVSGSQLTATVPAASIAAAGTTSITVTSPGVAASNVEFFDIRKSFPAVSFGESAVAIGEPPVGIVTADFNGDGRLDVATVDGYQAGFISILLGNGDGTFGTPTQYSIGYSPGGLVAADFNDDGHLDLVFYNYPGDSSAAASVMLGNGDGTFQQPQNSTLPLGPFFGGTTAGDFNGDGKLDLAVTENSPTAQVFILLGNGDGTFQAPLTYAVGTDGATSVKTGDFNGDGKLDLAVAVYYDADIMVLLGNGDGTFQDGVAYSTTFSGTDLAVADLNGDGRLDLGVNTPPDFTVLLGNGDGTFQPAANYQAGFKDYGAIAAADLNGDGILDLAIGELSSRISTALGKGNGTFEGVQPFAVGGGNSDCCLVAGDFNNDGLMDLAQIDNAGVVLSPAVTSVLSTTNIDFGKVTVGSTATRKATLSNIGTTSLSINKVKLAGNDSRDFSQSNNCGSSLGPGASCTFTLTFKPQAKAHYKEVLTISDSAVSELQMVTLQGVGTN